MATQLWALAAVLVSSALAAVAALFLKWAAGETRFSLSQPRVSLWAVRAIALYLLSSLFFAVALLGGQLSSLLPWTSLEYAWIALLARWFLRERLEAGKLAGLGGIVLGVVLVGWGS